MGLYTLGLKQLTCSAIYNIQCTVQCGVKCSMCSMHSAVCVVGITEFSLIKNLAALSAVSVLKTSEETV